MLNETQCEVDVQNLSNKIIELIDDQIAKFKKVEKRLEIRLTKLRHQLSCPQQIDFPMSKNYENYLSQIIDARTYTQFNFIFNDGQETNFKHNVQPVKNAIVTPTKVRKIKLYYSRNRQNRWLHGIQLLDDDSAILFTSGYNCFSDQS